MPQIAHFKVENDEKINLPHEGDTPFPDTLSLLGRSAPSQILHPLMFCLISPLMLTIIMMTVSIL